MNPSLAATQAMGTSSHQTVTHYQRISGPMLDRIDIHIEVPRVDFEKLSDNRRREALDEIRARVEGARHTRNSIECKPSMLAFCWSQQWGDDKRRYARYRSASIL